MYTLTGFGAADCQLDKECWRSCYYGRPAGEGSYAADERCKANCSVGPGCSGGTGAPFLERYKWPILGGIVVAVGVIVYKHRQ